MRHVPIDNEACFFSGETSHLQLEENKPIGTQQKHEREYVEYEGIANEQKTLYHEGPAYQLVHVLRRLRTANSKYLENKEHCKSTG